MSNWRLGTRLGVAATVVVALLLVAAIVVSVAYRNLITAERRITKTLFAGVEQSNDLSTAYLNEETGVRGYALAGTSDYLQPYLDGRTAEAAASKALSAGLGSEPELAGPLAALRDAANVWQTEFVEPALADVRANGPGSVSKAELDRGLALFNVVRAREADYNNAIAAARAVAVGDLHRARMTFAIAFGGVLLMLFVALCLLFVGLRRWVLEPLARVGEEALTVASGDIDHAVVLGRGPPEFVLLADDVDVMRRRIRDEYLEAQEARHSLEEQRKILAAQTVELKRSNAELEQFAYVASHDLQEPLRKVASFTQLLEQRYGDQLDERAHQYIEFAVDGSKRMQQLVQDLLAFSRVGRGGPEFATVSLDRALDTALRSLAHAIEESGAVVVREPLPEVRGDASLLAQVFQNLVGNAVKFRRPDEAPRIEIAVVDVVEDGVVGDGMCTISVTDHGIGIEPEFAEKVFAIFQRLNRREEYEGTGIGLALCRKIVEYHGGTIDLAPSVAHETTFVLTLPRAVPEGGTG